MESKDGVLSAAGEAGAQEGAVSVPRQASLEDLLPLEGGDCPWAPATSDAGGPRTLEATSAAGAGSKAPKKVIAQRVSGSVKWYNMKHGYGFIRRHDTQEEVFVHYSAVVWSGSGKHRRSLLPKEVVEFDVVQNEQGAEAAYVTRPASALANGCCFFYIYLGVPQPLRDAGGAKGDVADGEDGREDSAAAKGQRCCLTSSPHSQRQRRFPPFREALGATCSPATFASTSGPWAVHLPAPAPATGSRGAPPRRGHGLSYKLSRPRGRSTARDPDPKPSPDLAQELEAEKTESRSDADGLHQGSPPRYGCHCPNNPCDCYGPQPPPEEQGQTPEGGEGETGKGPAGKPACVAEKTSASEGEAAAAKASSAAQAQ